MKKKFDESVKNIGVNEFYTGVDLDWYFYEEKRPCYGQQMYYIDNGGNVRRCPLLSRYKSRIKLTESQESFNKRVKIPYLGKCREFNKSAFIWKNPNLSLEEYYDYIPQARQPILLGEFYVIVYNEVLKMPVYTYKTPLSIKYHLHNERKWNEKTREWENISFVSSNSYKNYDRVKRARIVDEWIPIMIPKGIPSSQEYIEKQTNITRMYLERQISFYKRMIESNPTEAEAYQSFLRESQEDIKNYPEKSDYNLGYGNFFLFVKRKDYEKFKKV